jgi:hypothetical protein
MRPSVAECKDAIGREVETPRRAPRMGRGLYFQSRFAIIDPVIHA